MTNKTKCTGIVLEINGKARGFAPATADIDDVCSLCDKDGLGKYSETKPQGICSFMGLCDGCLFEDQNSSYLKEVL